MIGRISNADRGLVGVAAPIFVITSSLAVIWCSSMSAMGMPMPGGWTMSMAWMRMPGQTWPGAAVAFLGMWMVMMAAMMLPSLVPMLARYRRSLDRPVATRVGWLTAVVAAGYYFVWAVVGAVAYPLGMAVAAFEMRHDRAAQAVPAVCAVMVLLAGLAQWTTWKARRLACCRATVPSAGPAATVRAAWRHGVSLGLDCARCCANLMVLVLVLGVMDLTVMALVTAAITAERLAPPGIGLAHATGLIAVLAGALMLAAALNSP